MTSDRDTERRIEEWLRETARPLPPHVLDSALERLPHVSRPRRAWLPFDVSPSRSLAVAAAVVVLVAVVAGPRLVADLGPTVGGLLGRPLASATPTVLATPAPSPTATASQSATPRPSPSPFGIDSVAGTGQRLNPTGTPIVTFTIGAETTPEGASGTYHFERPTDGLTFDGSVSCFIVSGSQAVIGGRVTSVTRLGATPLVGDGFLVFILDRGDPIGTNPGPDVVSQTYILPYDSTNVTVPGEFPTSCPDPLTTAHDAYDVTGNVVVIDR